jgi:hypothetical protein
VSDIDTAAADSLKVLDPKRPIREADMGLQGPYLAVAILLICGAKTRGEHEPVTI